jgi:hypothetical protein
MFPSVPRRRALLATAAAALAVPVLATGAQASLGPLTSTPRGQVTLETVGFGFLGTPDGISDVSFGSGVSQFTWYRGSVGAHVTGTMHVDNGQNAKFRVRVDSLTGNNGVISTAYDDKLGTVIKTASQDVPVDVTTASAPDMLKARITLEEKGAGPNWKDRGDFYTQAVPRTDDVMLLSRHIDVGGLGWASGAPTDDASVTWALGSDGALTATYRGFMHFNNYTGSGRVVLRAIDPLTGLAGPDVPGQTHAADGNGHEVAPAGNAPEAISLTSSVASSIQVVMQDWVPGPGPDGGAWADVASQTVSAGE